MTKQEVLKAIKELRDKIGNEADCSTTSEGWENEILDQLDRTADLIEFPKVETGA